MKNILLLGATGSIGESVLSVINENKSKLNLFGISLNNNLMIANKIIDDFNPSFVYIEDKDTLIIKNLKTVIYLNGDEELKGLINHQDVDIIISAISGFAGLKATHLAASSGKKILLANKESIVAGGDLILPLAKESNSEIIPIDSEHNAIFQCLSGEKGIDDVKRVTIQHLEDLL